MQNSSSTLSTQYNQLVLRIHRLESISLNSFELVDLQNLRTELKKVKTKMLLKGMEIPNENCQ